MIKALFEYTFLQNALFAAILASIVCGIIGAIVVEKKLVMMSGGVAHTSFGGIGLGYLLGIEPIWGAFLFTFLAALGIVNIRRKTNTQTDTIMGIFWAIGMALGLLFIAFMPGYPPDLSSYLFGDILTVSKMDIRMMFILDIIIVLIICLFYNYWKAYLFDEEFAKVLGVHTSLLEYIVFVLIAFAIVVLLRVVGIILVIALLTIPPATARLFVNNLKSMMIWSVILSLIFCIIGLIISYYFDIPSGATIIVLAGIVYMLMTIGKNIIRRIKNAHF